MNNNEQVSIGKSVRSESELNFGDVYDDPSVLSQNLNAVVLQYLESCGLEDSYTAFCKECQVKGVPFPKELRTPTFPKTTFKRSDAKLLLEFLDSEVGDKLIELWTAFVTELGQEVSQTVGAINFHVHVFAATAPHRQNKNETDKLEAMTKLRQFFQDQSHSIYADSEMLSLYALPYVPNPHSHSNFKNIFEDSWKEKLKSRIEDELSHYFESHSTNPGANSELAQMFLNYFQESGDESDGSEKLVKCVSSRSQTAAASAVNTTDVEVQTEESQLSIQKKNEMSEALQHAYAQNHRLNLEIQETKGKLFQTEDRYYKLIQSTAEVVSSLELAVQGKFQSIDALGERLLHVFPELFSPEKLQATLAAGGSNKSKFEIENVLNQNHPDAPRPCSSNSSDEYEYIQQNPNQVAPCARDRQEIREVPEVHVANKRQQQVQSNKSNIPSSKVNIPEVQTRMLKSEVNHNHPVASAPVPKASRQPPHQRDRSMPEKATEKLAAAARGNVTHLAAFPTAIHPNSGSTHAPPTSGCRPAAISMSPTNLRVEFQPICNKAAGAEFSSVPQNSSIGNTSGLRTQTRTILSTQPQQLLLKNEQNLADGEHGKVGKPKKCFRREANRKGDEGGDSSAIIGGEKPRRKWKDQINAANGNTLESEMPTSNNQSKPIKDTSAINTNHQQSKVKPPSQVPQVRGPGASPRAPREITSGKMKRLEGIPTIDKKRNN